MIYCYKNLSSQPNETTAGLNNLNGKIGSLIPILRQVLVYGFNEKTIQSITLTNTVAKVITTSNHGFKKNDVIRLKNATPSSVNKEYKIIKIIDSTTFEIQTNWLVVPTGGITCDYPPFGFEETFTETNEAVFRAKTGRRHFIKVTDTTALYCAITMYESMTGLNTGVNGSQPVYWHKSNYNTTDTIQYIFVGSSTWFYFAPASHRSYAQNCTYYFFGEYQHLDSNYLYNTALMGHQTSNISSNVSYYQSMTYLTTASISYSNGCKLLRNILDQANSNAEFAKLSINANSTSYAQIGDSSFVPLNKYTGFIELYPIEMAGMLNNKYYHIGRLPVIYNALNNVSSIFSSIFTKIINNNRLYAVIQIQIYSDNVSYLFFDITSEL